MKLITLAQARDHCHDDGDADALLLQYIDSAEAACAQIANRNLYMTAADQAAAVAAVPTTMSTAYSAYDAAVDIANSADDDRMRSMMLANAKIALDRASITAERTVNGITVEQYPDIAIAVLMTVGHFYRNRENVVSGQGAAAIEVPMSAHNIMSNLRWIGSQLP